MDHRKDVLYIYIYIIQGTTTHCVYESVPFMVLQSASKKYKVGGTRGAFQAPQAQAYPVHMGPLPLQNDDLFKEVRHQYSLDY